MRLLKWILGIVAALVLLGYFVGMPYLREKTKKHSPERTATYAERGLDLKVTYCSPSKRAGRSLGAWYLMAKSGEPGPTKRRPLQQVLLLNWGSSP